MGRDFQSLTSNESNISDAYQELLRPTFGRMIFGGLNFMLPQWIVQWLPLSSNRILDEISSFLKKTCGEILEDKKREIAEGKDSLPDYSILKRIIETGELTDEETKDQMLTFLAAGVSGSYFVLFFLVFSFSLSLSFLLRPALDKKLTRE